MRSRTPTWTRIGTQTPIRSGFGSRPCGLRPDLLPGLPSGLALIHIQTRIRTRSATRTAIRTPTRTIIGAPLFGFSRRFPAVWHCGTQHLDCVCQRKPVPRPLDRRRSTEKIRRAGVETLARDENDKMTGRLTSRAGGKVGDNFVGFIRSD